MELNINHPQASDSFLTSKSSKTSQLNQSLHETNLANKMREASELDAECSALSSQSQSSENHNTTERMMMMSL